MGPKACVRKSLPCATSANHAQHQQQAKTIDVEPELVAPTTLVELGFVASMGRRASGCAPTAAPRADNASQIAVIQPRRSTSRLCVGRQSSIIAGRWVGGILPFFPCEAMSM